MRRSSMLEGRFQILTVGMFLLCLRLRHNYSNALHERRKECQNEGPSKRQLSKKRYDTKKRKKQAVKEKRRYFEFEYGVNFFQLET